MLSRLTFLYKAGDALPHGFVAEQVGRAYIGRKL